MDTNHISISINKIILAIVVLLFTSLGYAQENKKLMSNQVLIKSLVQDLSVTEARASQIAEVLTLHQDSLAKILKNKKLNQPDKQLLIRKLLQERSEAIKVSLTNEEQNLLEKKYQAQHAGRQAGIKATENKNFEKLKKPVRGGALKGVKDNSKPTDKPENNKPKK